MKKLFTVVLLMLVGVMLGTHSVLRQTLDLYIIMHFKKSPVYVNCVPILTQAVSKNNDYRPFFAYMNEEIYNNLSIKTKSYYREGQDWDNGLYVLSQVQDVDDARLIYVDIITYPKTEAFEKSVTLRQLVIFKENNSWKVIKYIEPIKSGWYKPTYLGRVYSFILP